MRSVRNVGEHKVKRVFWRNDGANGVKNPWVGRGKCEKTGGIGDGKKSRKGYVNMFLFPVPERKTSEWRGKKRQKRHALGAKGLLLGGKEGGNEINPQ